MTHVGERMKLLNCVSQHMEALAKISASAPRAVSKYRANVPDQGARPPFGPLQNGGRKWAGDETNFRPLK